MKKLLLFILLTTCINITVHAQKTWKTITQDAYTIKHPSNWTSDTSGKMGVDVFLFSEHTSAEDKFAENVNVLVQDLAGYDIDLDKYTEISEQQIKTMMKDGKITKSERITSGSQPYHRIIYVGKQSGFDLKFEQRYYVKNEKAFVLTLTCEASQFDNYKAIGTKIMGSFQLK